VGGGGGSCRIWAGFARRGAGGLANGRCRQEGIAHKRNPPPSLPLFCSTAMVTEPHCGVNSSVLTLWSLCIQYCVGWILCYESILNELRLNRYCLCPLLFQLSVLGPGWAEGVREAARGFGASGDWAPLCDASAAPLGAVGPSSSRPPFAFAAP